MEYMAREMPLVFRVRMVITAWGTKEMLVRKAAAKPNHSMFMACILWPASRLIPADRAND
jgi:hypothetical protein